MLIKNVCYCVVKCFVKSFLLVIGSSHCWCIGTNKHGRATFAESQLHGHQARVDAVRMFLKLRYQGVPDCKADSSMSWFAFFLTDCKEGVACTILINFA